MSDTNSNESTDTTKIEQPDENNESSENSKTAKGSAGNAVNDDTRGDLIRRIRQRVTGQLISFAVMAAIGVGFLLYGVFSGVMGSGTATTPISAALITVFIVMAVTVLGMGISVLVQHREPKAILGFALSSVIVILLMVVGYLLAITESLAAIVLGNYAFGESGVADFVAGMPMWLYTLLIVALMILFIVLYVRSIKKTNEEVETTDKPLRVHVYVLIMIVAVAALFIIAAGAVLILLDVFIGVAVMAAIVLIAPPTLLSMMIMRPQYVLVNAIAAVFVAFGMLVAIGLSSLVYWGM